MQSYRQYYIYLWLCYFMLLSARHLGHSELFYWGGDESRHFMNGVFVKDLIADGGWRTPMHYLRWYYLKYPALSVHQYPPLFYLCEALLFSIFGLHVGIVQTGIFMLMGVSFCCWYRSLARKFTPEVALFSLFVLTSTHLFLNNFARIMLDGAAMSLILLLLSALDRWQATNRRRWCWAALALVGMLIGTAITTYFMAFYFGLYLISRKYAGTPRRTQRKALSLAFLTMFLGFFLFGTIAMLSGMPLLYRTFQGINMLSLFKIQQLMRARQFPMLFQFDVIEVFGVPLLLLALLGALFLLRQKEWGKAGNDLLYAANFLFIFTLCVTHFESHRFNLFLLPVIALLSGYALAQIIVIFPKNVLPLGAAAVFIVCGWKGLSHPTWYVRGYEPAARAVAALNTGRAPILCDAYLDGNFIAYLRQVDPFKQQIVFRGDKLLFAFSIYYRELQEVYVEQEADMYALLNRYSIRYIVVDRIVKRIPPKILLRSVLQNPAKFRHIAAYPVTTNLDYADAGLDLYEYLDYNSRYDEVVNIRMPVVNASYSFTVQELRTPFTALY